MNDRRSASRHPRSLIVSLPLWLLGACSPHSTDEELLANFEQHEAGFEQLLDMLRTDEKLERVDATWTRPDELSSVGISP